MVRLKKREQFLAAARGTSWATRGCVVQMHIRPDEGPARIGFTTTRKLGNAVRRNRIRRRLREAVRLAAGLHLQAGRDYVFIGRAATFERDFSKLENDVVEALTMLNAGKTQGRRAKGPARGRHGSDQGMTFRTPT